MFNTDVFVIGGGPAGIAAAVAAARQGFTVTLADACKPPLDKACGEGMMPDSLEAAARLGIEIPDDVGFPFGGIRFHGKSHRVAARFPRGAGRGVRRTVLHSLLVEAAQRAGVQMLWGTPVTAIDGNTVRMTKSSLTSRWIIGADGGQSFVRRWAGLGDSVWNSRRFAQRQHFAIKPWTGMMEIYWADGCQVYTTPVAHDVVCIALMARTPELRLEEALTRFFPELHARLAGAEIVTRQRGAVTSSVRLRNVAAGHVALVGDASGCVDAITGEGLCLSFREAEVLAESLKQGDLAPYNRAHPGLARRAHLMAKTMLVLDRGPAIRYLGLSALSAQPWIFRQLLAAHVL